MEWFLRHLELLQGLQTIVTPTTTPNDVKLKGNTFKADVPSFECSVSLNLFLYFWYRFPTTKGLLLLTKKAYGRKHSSNLSELIFFQSLALSLSLYYCTTVDIPKRSHNSLNVLSCLCSLRQCIISRNEKSVEEYLHNPHKIHYTKTL